MKQAMTFLIALTFGPLALGTQAGERSEQELAVCAAELNAYYGADTRIEVVSRQRTRYGTHLRVSARIDEHNSQFANCWVDTDEMAALDLQERSEQIAVVEPSAD